MEFPGYGICSFVFIYKLFQNIFCHAMNSQRKNVKNLTPWRVFHARLCSPYFQFYQQHPYIMLSPIPSQLCGVHFYAHKWKRWASQENLPKILPEFDVRGSCNGCLFLRDSSPKCTIRMLELRKSTSSSDKWMAFEFGFLPTRNRSPYLFG